MAAALGLALLVPIDAGAQTVISPAYDRTSALERHRVDSVPTPTLAWRTCYASFQCATAALPLDYDHPRGPQVMVALLKSPARMPAERTGTLFLDPGGPGGSGTESARYAPETFGPEVLDHFDVVGFDPRGVGASDQVRCFPSAAAAAPVLDTISSISFPDSRPTAVAYLKATKTLGRACATTGRPLSVSMSTAEVARDLDVLRRAVGDPQLTYLGWSYGTYIGQVYANLFPDRVRAVVMDGVVDPVGWRGNAATHNEPTWLRIHSPEASARALHEVLVRCDQAGTTRCAYAAGDPVARFDRLSRRLKKHPVEVDDGAGGTYAFGYADLIGTVLAYLYAFDGPDGVIQTLVNLDTVSDPSRASTAAGRRAAVQLTAARAHLSGSGLRDRGLAPRAAADAPYDNSDDTFTAVSCTDSEGPDHIASIPRDAARADRRVPYFGGLWAWNTPMCARDAFTGRDEDAYRGSFTHRTRRPILFVGDTWDPATNVRSAVKAAELAPNSALILSDSWGHTAYGTSACLDDAVDHYIATARPSSRLLLCRGDYQPFTGASSTSSAAALSARPSDHQGA